MTARAPMAMGLLALGAMAGCRTAPCTDGTLFVSASFQGATTGADAVDLIVTVGATTRTFRASHVTGAVTETFEIGFAGLYPTGSALDVRVTALASESPLGSGTTHATLTAGCSAIAVQVGDATTDGGTLDAAGTDLAGADLSAPDLRGADLGSTPTSCAAGANQICGANGAEDCCTSPLVGGGSYKRSNISIAPATLSDFRLDRYEITVGRFRAAFVEAGMGTQASPPAAGAGANPNLQGSGWDATWNTHLPTSTAELKTAVKCQATYQMWTDSMGAHEKRPMNCIDWYEAFAFCIWDGGRLPTEAEWNYAAAAGNDQRVYPWSVPATSTTIDDSYAVYTGGAITITDVGPKSPTGDTVFGQADISGSVGEWVLDWFDDYSATCLDCANLTAGGTKVFRGGAWFDPPASLTTVFRNDDYPTFRDNGLGARCARAP